MSSSMTENSDRHTLKKVNIFVYVLAVHMASAYNWKSWLNSQKLFSFWLIRVILVHLYSTLCMFSLLNTWFINKTNCCALHWRRTLFPLSERLNCLKYLVSSWGFIIFPHTLLHVIINFFIQLLFRQSCSWNFKSIASAITRLNSLYLVIYMILLYIYMCMNNSL